MEQTVLGNGGGEASPHNVLRGVKHQLVNLAMDSLYVIVEYPHLDVFQRWASGVSDLSDPRLFEGVPYQGTILKRGGSGYKLSSWDGDARLFVTDRVDDRLEETGSAGQGMGVMLQLGPKWLLQFGEPFSPNTLRSNLEAQLILFGIEQPTKYPIRINRLDIALDVLGLAVADFSVDEWLAHWVGYAKPRNFHFHPRSGALTGFSVGSYKGNVRFKVYDKTYDAERIGESGFWRSVWGVDEFGPIDVTRFEWSIRCYQAKFVNMLRYLSEYTFEGFLGILNYVSQKWGSLRVPDGADENHKARWPLHPLWAEIIAFIDDYSFNYERFVRPQYDLCPDIKPSYLKSVTGWLAGLQARLGVEKGKDGPASMAEILSYLHHEGHTMEDIFDKAGEKWEVFSKLAGVRRE